MLAMETGKTPYPPALTGLRGNHDGSWEVAHALARGGRGDRGKIYREDSTEYDLVVVGAVVEILSRQPESPLGRSDIEAGDLENAAVYYARFVELWADADAELQPRVEAARTRLEEIIRERG